MPSSEPVGSVYIVDDDPAVRGALALLVESSGWEVAAYPSAEAFLGAYRRGDADCLVLDLQMPGMNGVELQQELAARGIDIPIIVITAFSDHPLTLRAREAGALTILTKPFKHEALLRSIKQALARGG
jgi:two-component system, LuxR family, response regulator FixJ